MEILEKEFLHEQLIKSLNLYSENSLSSLKMLAHMRVVQAPIIERLFKKISKEKNPSKKEIEQYTNCSDFEEKMFYFSIINQCSMFDALITDVETILILLEHKSKLQQIKTSPAELAAFEPEQIIMKGAREISKNNSFEGIKKRLSNIYSNYNLKNRPEISLFEECEEVFKERNALIHAPFSFTDREDKQEWDPFSDNDARLKKKEATLGEASYRLCKQVLAQKFNDHEQPMLLLIKQTFAEPNEVQAEFDKLIGPDKRTD